MLVVTRRPNEKITFPTLGITVQILRVNGTTAKVGIEAPPEIRIIRNEVVDDGAVRATRPKSDHTLANALSKVTLAIHLARKQWEVGRSNEADTTLSTALRSLEELEPMKQTMPPARRCRTLIVEDDANQRELLAGLLTMNGCDCETAADGEDALTYLAAGGRPDVVLLDMSMPRCDGPETLRRIRSNRSYDAVRVFSVSSTNPRDLNIPDGFDGWFPKPLNPRRLWDAIQTTINSTASTN